MKAAILFVSFVLAGGAFAFWIADALPPVGEAARKQVEVRKQVAPVRFIRGVGYVEPASEIRNLTFKVDGVVETCPVQVGQMVEAEEILSTLRNHDERSAIVVAEQELSLAKAERNKLLSGVHPAEVVRATHRVAKLEAKWQYTQQRYDRELKLNEQKVSTEETLEQAATELHQTREELKEAQAELQRLETYVREEDRALAMVRVKLAEANLAAARARFDDTILTAPIPGTVLEILKREGEAVRVYDPTPVLVFGDLTRLRIRAEIDERFVNQVHVGQAAVLFGRGFGDQRIDGKVVLVKELMGKKTVFSRESAERKDVEVLQVFIEPAQPLDLPVGLKVDVELQAP
ncbi:MAG: efflux RND transporter periplasmic adaptor subunit [Pirellulales bacterium]